MLPAEVTQRENCNFSGVINSGHLRCTYVFESRTLLFLNAIFRCICAFFPRCLCLCRDARRVGKGKIPSSPDLVPVRPLLPLRNCDPADLLPTHCEGFGAGNEGGRSTLNHRKCAHLIPEVVYPVFSLRYSSGISLPVLFPRSPVASFPNVDVVCIALLCKLCKVKRRCRCTCFN